MSVENLATSAKCLELKISHKLLAVFFNTQFFERQTMGKCSVCVSECIPLYQII